MSNKGEIVKEEIIYLSTRYLKSFKSSSRRDISKPREVSQQTVVSASTYFEEKMGNTAINRYFRSVIGLLVMIDNLEGTAHNLKELKDFKTQGICFHIYDIIIIKNNKDCTFECYLC